jgi:hypothetical protein
MDQCPSIQVKTAKPITSMADTHPGSLLPPLEKDFPSSIKDIYLGGTIPSKAINIWFAILSIYSVSFWFDGFGIC